MNLIFKQASALPTLQGINILFCAKDPEGCAKDCIQEGCKDLVLVTVDQECAENLSLELRKALYRMGRKS